MIKRIYWVFVSFLCLSGAYGQDVKLNSGFVQDSLKIGMDVQYWMTVQYPPDLDLIMPDSSSSFKPFELNGMQYFPTELRDSLAFDSAVYNLVSFEIDNIQQLALSARIPTDNDTILIPSPPDSIRLIELVETATDTTALKENTDYQKVETEFNTPLLLIIVGALLIILITILLIFGKRIRKYFRLKKLAKRHKDFLALFDEHIRQLKGDGSPEKAEKALVDWKQYLEKLEKIPYSKLTSKEIIKTGQAGELKEVLKAIDKCVYGKVSSKHIYQDFQHLVEFAENRYNEQVEQLKYGK